MATKTTKETIVALPVIGYLLRLGSNFARLPKFEEAVIADRASTAHAFQSIQDQNTAAMASLTQLNDELNDRLASVEQAQDSIRQEISKLERGGPVKAAKQNDELFADDHLMDKFYTGFEDKFRGSEDMIMERQEEYLPLFKKSMLDFKKTPVLDIGSGRGEFIQLLKKNKIPAIGLDINLDMVERAKKKGLDAQQGDALSFLQDKKSQTYGAITGFHIVEHIPFNVLLRICSNIHRTLATGGFVLFETPNPENVIVATHNFYMDPSHLHPLPPILLAFALETAGFKNVEIMRLHPDEEGKDTKLPKEVADRFYGPRDYAVVGYK